ncbi:hypothetical protein GBAR_LOCUS620 [Geodia barretti]|uniref:Uncharacterized protein n=1 Tax=Geodia barretti TaxID=519541 RepID=A0AA35QT65_GEOBA|nr:hypothetical protein GBAR_LOCUS620 [Geodia barretti]
MVVVAELVCMVNSPHVFIVGNYISWAGHCGRCWWTLRTPTSGPSRRLPPDYPSDEQCFLLSPDLLKGMQEVFKQLN